MKQQTYKNPEFGKWVARTRKEMGLSQEEFAAQVKMSRSFIGRIETNTVGYSREAAVTIIDSLLPKHATQPEVAELREEVYYMIGLVPPGKESDLAPNVLPLSTSLRLDAIVAIPNLDLLNNKDWRDIALTLRNAIEARIDKKIKQIRSAD